MTLIRDTTAPIRPSTPWRLAKGDGNRRRLTASEGESTGSRERVVGIAESIALEAGGQQA
jgi:hypothetical protein